LNPAIQLGVQQRVGSIDVGKDADLVIFNGHPFSVYTLVDTTIIEGNIYFDRSADVEARDKNEKEKQTLLESERKQSQPQTQPGAAQRNRRPNEKGGDQ
jgi:adenine deaminase